MAVLQKTPVTTFKMVKTEMTMYKIKQATAKAETGRSGRMMSSQLTPPETTMKSVSMLSITPNQYVVKPLSWHFGTDM